MEGAQRKSIRGNLAVSCAVMAAIAMQYIYAIREFETETDALEKRAFDAKGWEE